jgi:hypothetical protein
MENDRKIAVLIDADNVSEKYIKFILDELSNHGTPTIKRIYGDWTNPHLTSWKSVLLNYSITPIQQYSYTTGKNATDAALIIDAMDILYSNNVEGFCIVSSDSDFTRLAARLREAGKYVVGMGEKKTPMPFISACEKFKYLEVLAGTGGTNGSNNEKPVKPGQQKNEMGNKKELVSALITIIRESSDEDGWAYLGEVGKRLNIRYPDFDTRNYGHAKLTPLINSLKQFEVQARKSNHPHINHYFVKIKSNQPEKS